MPLAIGTYSSDEEGDSDHTYLPEITFEENQDDTESVESFITADPASRVATPTPDDSIAAGTSLGRTAGLFNSSALNASGETGDTQRYSDTLVWATGWAWGRVLLLIEKFGRK